MRDRWGHHPGVNRLSAHLERGWDLVQRGDAAGAQASARRALEVDDQAPEAHNLLGYAAALAGDFEGALECYRRALAIDENYFEVLLNAAEILVHPLVDYAGALDMCERALELAEDEEERVDTLLLMFDALLGEGRAGDARQLCAEFPQEPMKNPHHTFLVGRAYYEVGDLERAAPLLGAALESGDDNAEAQYYAGLLHDELGRREPATSAFLRARSLDLQADPASWSLSREAFEMLLKRAVAGLDETLHSVLRPGECYVADLPGVELVVDGVDPRALLLLDDIEQVDGQPRARVFVYQRNLERLAGSLEALQDEVQAALERELSAVLEECDEELATQVATKPHKHQLN